MNQIISMIPDANDIFKNSNIVDFTFVSKNITYLTDTNGKYIVDDQSKFIILNNE